jgi:hypothetical protein
VLKLWLHHADFCQIARYAGGTMPASDQLSQRSPLTLIRTEQGKQSQRELLAYASMKPKYFPIRAEQGRLLG